MLLSMKNSIFTDMSMIDYKVISIMSGTSLDGLDVLYTKFWKEEQWEFKILHSETIPYSNNWSNRLKNLTQVSEVELEDIDNSYSELLANEILKFITKKSITEIDFIASHGHTALHKPDKGFTYQIGNKQIIADVINRKVICDFRIQDVKLGGQGAPLVPIGDKLLFSEYDFCINLGGFANISFEDKNKRIAFDICPVNIVLNHYASNLGLDFDKDGINAKSGKIDYLLLEQLNSIEFYKKSHPKSLGLEWVEKQVFPLISQSDIETKDILRTFVEHSAVQISKYLQEEDKKALFSGGGVYNSFLIERINHYSKVTTVIPDKLIIEFKEALIFGLLGVLKERNEINCLKSVTGASTDHSSGVILYPIN